MAAGAAARNTTHYVRGREDRDGHVRAASVCRHHRGDNGGTESAGWYETEDVVDESFDLENVSALRHPTWRSL